MRHFLTFLITISFTTISAQIKLQYNLVEGDSFTINQEAKQEIFQEINNAEQIINNDLVGEMFFKVVEIDTGFITFEMSFTKIKLLMSSPTLGELMSMDSSSENDDIMTKMMKGVLNFPVTIKMKRNGKIESVLGGEKLVEKMFISAGITQPEVIESSKASMEKQFGNQALTNNFEQMTYIFSDSVIREKDSWNNEYLGDLSVVNTWTLETIDDSTYHISGKGETVMKTTSQTVSMSLSGNQTTSAKGNINTGLITELLVSGEIKGNTEMSGLTVPTTIKSTITYKISQ